MMREGQRVDEYVSVWKCRQGSRSAAAARVNDRWEADQAADEAMAAFHEDLTGQGESSSGRSSRSSREDDELLFSLESSGDCADDILLVCQAAKFPPAVKFKLPSGTPSHAPEWSAGQRPKVPLSWYDEQLDGGEWVRRNMYQHSVSRSLSRSIAIETAAAERIRIAWQRMAWRRGLAKASNEHAKQQEARQLFLLPPSVVLLNHPNRRRRQSKSHFDEVCCRQAQHVSATSASLLGLLCMASKAHTSTTMALPTHQSWAGYAEGVWGRSCAVQALEYQ